jgi:hypothetical protein
MAKNIDHHEVAISYASRVFSKTASALPASAENNLIRNKVVSSIDSDKVCCIDSMYKHASIIDIMGPAALKALAATGTIAAVSAVAAPAVARRTAAAAVRGGSEASKEKATEFKNYALGVGIPATLVAALGAAKAGIFGEKAEDYADNVTDKVLNLFAKKNDSTSQFEPELELGEAPMGSTPYKLAAAKTYHKLKTAELRSQHSGDIEKLSAASAECAKILFDSVFYL